MGLVAEVFGGFRHGLQHIRSHHFEHFRNRHENRDAAAPDLPGNLVRVVAVQEKGHAGQHGGDERRHGLAEHMAQRQQIQEANGIKRFAIKAVFPHFFFNGDDVRQNIAMR